jgi:hypothetical protein
VNLRSSSGQASVELLAFLPLVLLLALVVLSLLAGHAASEEAGQAAEAGALALLQSRDPRSAAHAALPERADADIQIHGSKVTVHVRPRVPLPLVAGILEAAATADAGPEAP